MLESWLGPGKTSGDEGLFRLTKKALVGTGYKCMTIMNPDYKQELILPVNSWKDKYGIKKLMVNYYKIYSKNW